MAVRIYSLAKELKLDSKELVELCTRAGIQDKGSALASLDDTEVARLKEFISGKSKSPEKPTATTETTATPKAPAVMKREDYVAPTGAARQGRPKELGSKRLLQSLLRWAGPQNLPMNARVQTTRVMKTRHQFR